jgi:hypothetical protein
MKNNETVDLAFEYAKKAGVNMIVGAPNYELLPYVEKKIKEYDLKLAIHNHGPDNPQSCINPPKNKLFRSMQPRI